MANENIRWTKEDNDFLTVNWHSMTTEDIAKKLHRSENAVKNRANMMGLRKKGFVTPMRPMCLPTTNNNKKYAQRANAKSKKVVDPVAGKIPVRIDHRTVIYVAAGTPQKEIEKIMQRYPKQQE